MALSAGSASRAIYFRLKADGGKNERAFPFLVFAFLFSPFFFCHGPVFLSLFFFPSLFLLFFWVWPDSQAFSVFLRVRKRSKIKVLSCRPCAWRSLFWNPCEVFGRENRGAPESSRPSYEGKRKLSLKKQKIVATSKRSTLRALAVWKERVGWKADSFGSKYVFDCFFKH